MTIKITIPNTSSDTLTFGSANTPTAAQIAGIDSGSSNGQLAIYTTASGTSTERIRVDASGNVGIGTSSPGTYTTGAAISVSSAGAETTPLALVNPNSTANTQVSLAFIPNSNIPLAKISAIRTTAGGLTSMTFGTYNGASVVEAVRIDNSANLMFNSGYGTAATAYGCRAWIAWSDNGTATTTRGSGNVTSITRNATSDYTINFTTAMPDANYSVTGNSGYNTTSMAALVVPINLTAPTTSAVRVQSVSVDGTLRSIAANIAFYSIAIFR